ncbi:MAG: fibronectin type III domain-containing protein [Bdellovibrionales bacterium]|nr:fibronectin type III domain-containing protein [Bdellovibrionales bacterium]
MRRLRLLQYSAVAFVTVATAVTLYSCGSAQEISGTSETTISGGSSGGGGGGGSAAIPRSVNLIFPIRGTPTIQAFDNRWPALGVNDANLPFVNAAIPFGSGTNDRQSPGVFDLTSYPTSNFTFSKATIFVTSSKDTTDTEGILIAGCNSGNCAAKDGTGRFGGVFTGYPFHGMIRGSCGSPSSPTQPDYVAAMGTAGAGCTNITGGYNNTQGNCTVTGSPCTVAAACATSPFLLYDFSHSANAVTANTSYIDYALNNYSPSQANTYELDIASLIAGSPYTAQSMVESKAVLMVLGDDSKIAAAPGGSALTSSYPTGISEGANPRGDGLLLVNGTALSDVPLTCLPSNDASLYGANFTFSNHLIHKDGNSTGTSFFKAAANVTTPGYAFNSIGTYGGVEFHFNAVFPKANVDSLGAVDTSFITLNTATLRLSLRKSAAVPSAIVINGIGIAQAGFDTSLSTVGEVTWTSDSSIIAAWDAWVAALPGAMVGSTAFTGAPSGEATVDLNLLSLLGATTMKSLIAQGKLNIAIAGGITAVNTYATLSNPYPNPGSTPTPHTSNRKNRIQVYGPNFLMSGSYYTNICTIPPPPAVVSGAGQNPSILGHPNTGWYAPIVTSNSVTIQWATDELTTSDVLFGAGAPVISWNTTEAPPAATTTHSRTVTGLQPNRYYAFQVKGTDVDGNVVTSNAILIKTLK